MKGFYVPKTYLIVVAVFALFFILGIFRSGNPINGLSMGCLFGSLVSLIMYVVYASKKIKSGVLLFSFIAMLAVFLITTPFTKGAEETKDISVTTTQSE